MKVRNYLKSGLFALFIVILITYIAAIGYAILTAEGYSTIDND
jgi:hypothetical protein